MRIPSQSARRAALALLLPLITACEPGPPATEAPPIPEGHPCPERALPPEAASLWSDQRASGEPVPLTLTLPLPLGEAFEVSQGNDQDPTHHGVDRWAWDFAAPEGTAVRAAAPGIVAFVRDDSTRFGVDPSYRGDANFILVDHGGGLFTAYVHLAAQSAEVSPGDPVLAGAPLARTGLSGQLSGPHLHFQVENTWSDSLPARFADPPAGRCDLLPERGDWVTADPTLDALLVGRGEPSPMPPDAFAPWGLSELEGLPARLFERRARYRIAGAAAPGATEVFVLLIPPEGGTAAASWRFEVREGRFSGEIMMGEAPAGSYGLGAIAVGPDDEVAVERSIRVSLR